MLKIFKCAWENSDVSSSVQDFHRLHFEIVTSAAASTPKEVRAYPQRGSGPVSQAHLERRLRLDLVSLCLSHIQPRAPYDFYHPYDFLPVRPSEAPVGILRWCCSHGHIRLRPRTVRHGCILMVWLNNSQDSTGTPYDARTGIARAPHGNLQFFHILRGPRGTRKGAARRPCGHVRELTQPELAKIPLGRRICPYGARAAPYGHRTGSLGYLNPYGAHKLIMHALKLYGSPTDRQNSYGAARVPCVDVRFLFKTAREKPVRVPGV